MFIGCHLSASDGYEKMGKTAISIGANTMQFFTRNPRGGSVRAADENDAAALCRLMEENGFGKIIAHAPYTVNLCSKDESVRGFGRRIIKEDLERLELIPGCLYNIHPGSHTGLGTEAGIDFITGAVNSVLNPDMKSTLLFETMAGKGSEIGSNFGEIRSLIDRTELKSKVGVCLDTCHVFDGGYDLVSDTDGVLREFDKIIGLEYLRAVHINDSKNILGSHKDRHEKIGQGNIGLETFVRIINHPLLAGLPFVLETPNELDGYAKEIELLKSYAS